ncbi:hypothetical protein Dvar_35250 [Desulfosarcina variabilis str. Montpellier]|uniref:hypothetical protein n=1 Tax=Desulfosarcina variabilis TaxID=2300 RepID=UPI003AFA65BE
MSGRFVHPITALIIFILASCSGAPTDFKGTWNATPGYHEVVNSVYKVRLTPQKGSNSYYAFFLLSLVNNSGTALSIDWNASRYVHGGKPEGRLVFEGIDPQAVKTHTVPIESIPPGGQLERKLMPMRLIAWNPIKEKTADARGIAPGMLPAGENGVLLSLRQAGGSPQTISLSVSLSIEK